VIVGVIINDSRELLGWFRPRRLGLNWRINEINAEKPVPRLAEGRPHGLIFQNRFADGPQCVRLWTHGFDFELEVA
jgi:hypothetical protein